MGCRIDKWLWAVRVFKTRTQASEACRAGLVKLDSQRVKPSLEVRAGMELTVRRGSLERTLAVVAPLEKRVAAAKVPEFMEDRTPPETYAAHQQRTKADRILREPGTGRPTKKDRRQLDELFGD